MKRTVVIFASGVGVGLAAAWLRETHRRYVVFVERKSGPREVHP